MNAWDQLPQVVISQGRFQDCGGNAVVYNQAMQNGFQRSWPGSGDQGDDICWRRTSDLFNPNSGLGEDVPKIHPYSVKSTNYFHSSNCVSEMFGNEAASIV
jgi:hypothetical protein